MIFWNLGVRLLPIILIALVRSYFHHPVAIWLIALTTVECIPMVVLGTYLDALRGTYLAHEYNATVADPLRKRMSRIAPFWQGLVVGYVALLIALLVI